MKRVLELWDLIAGLIIVAFMFGSLKSTQDAQASKITEVEKIRDDVSVIKTDVAEIKGELKHLTKGK